MSVNRLTSDKIHIVLVIYLKAELYYGYSTIEILTHYEGLSSFFVRPSRLRRRGRALRIPRLQNFYFLIHVYHRNDKGAFRLRKKQRDA